MEASQMKQKNIGTQEFGTQQFGSQEFGTQESTFQEDLWDFDIGPQDDETYDSWDGPDMEYNQLWPSDDEGGYETD